jgi:hypothetical protein
MSFHSSQVIRSLKGTGPETRTGVVKIGGEEFPGFGTDEEKVARLERAMVNIYATRGSSRSIGSSGWSGRPRPPCLDQERVARRSAAVEPQ